MIEVMIVMTLISIVVGVMGFGVNRALNQQSFRSEVVAVIDQLRLSQELMVILNADVRVHFVAESDQIKVWLETETGLAKGWERELARSGRELRAVEKITFDDVTLEEEGELTLEFLSGGTVMSKGILSLSFGDESRHICLPGYPRPIISVIDKERCLEEDSTRDDEALTLYTVQAVKPETIQEEDEEEAA